MRTKIIDGVTLFILTLLAVVFLVIYVPKLFGLSSFYVETDSMLPDLPIGSVVFTKQVEFEDIKQDDIITFSNETSTKYCTHRVVQVNEKSKSFVTKGDNNNINDPFETPYEFIRGKVVFSLPVLGYLVMILDTSAARIVAVVLAVVLIAVEIEIYKLKKKGGRRE